MKPITCLRCGWVNAAVSRGYAEASVKRFNDYYDSISDEEQKSFGSRATVEGYEGCFACGGKDFRAFREGDCPDGVTINPVICEELPDE